MPRSALVPSINFFRQRRRKLEVLQKRDKYVFYGFGAVLVVVVVITLALAGLNYLQQQELQNLERQNQSEQRLVKELASREAEYLLFVSRLDLLGQILREAHSQQATLQFLLQLSQPGISFQDIQFENKNRQLTFRVLADDVFRLESFINILRSPEVQQQVSNVQVSSVNRQPDGRYGLEIETILAQEAANAQEETE